jgi:hypothetical protein
MSPGQGGELQEGGWVSRAALLFFSGEISPKSEINFYFFSELSDFGGFQLPKEVRKITKTRQISLSGFQCVAKNIEI